MTTLNALGRQLGTQLAAARERHEKAVAHRQPQEKINIVGAGKALTAAYEQLRNAAENTEEHLLLQNAIRRFYKQLFIMRDEEAVRSSGNELAIELTLAGYIPNDTLVKEQIDTISHMATHHYLAYETALSQRSVNQDKAFSWILSTLAVSAESVLNDHMRDKVFIDFAYQQLSQLMPESMLTDRQEKNDYSAALFAAIHKALLKSDAAVIRTQLLERYHVDVRSLEQYISINHRIDELLNSPFADKIFHMVDRQGAPLRVLRRMIEEQADFTSLLEKRTAFLDAYEKQVTREYSRITKRVNRAIVRSVLFLVITKFIVGIAIEVPYDIWMHGAIIWLPLIVNLLFPPIYMVALRLTHALPGYANTTALVDRVDAMLYGEKISLMRRELTPKKFNILFSAAYSVVSLIVFAGVIYLLLLLRFELLHIVIFFVFLSTASFLGFRLSRLIREIEVVRSASNGLTLLRDVVYLPFVLVGQWISDKYSKINIVTIVLDMLIELPLKTTLRLVRQWSAFIDDRKDRI